MSGEPGKRRAPGRVPFDATVTPLVGTPAPDKPHDEPTAGEVLHRVLARSARTFLLNDAGIVPGVGRGEVRAASGTDGAGPVGTTGDHPSVAGTIVTLGGAPRHATEMERIRQSRVACRRIRSNLRTFRLLVEPVWSTSLRAELAWYADCLGESRDLHVLRDAVVLHGPLLVDEDDLRAVVEVIDGAIGAAEVEVDHARESDRYSRLIGQTLLLWDGPLLTANAGQPAEDMLPTLLERSWRDVRGAARTARKQTTDEHLHKLRIRVKGLRYGCETTAVVEGGPARKTAKAAERLQRRLGDLHDAGLSVAWLADLAVGHPDLADAGERLAVVLRAQATQARKGWKDEYRELERRWRRWRG